MEEVKNKSQLIWILKGYVIAIVSTIILLSIFSILLVNTSISEKTINPTIITLTCVSILIGSTISMRKVRKNGLLNGALIGIIYVFTIYLISSFLKNSFSFNISAIIMFLMGICGGIIGGLIGVNTAH